MHPAEGYDSIIPAVNQCNPYFAVSMHVVGLPAIGGAKVGALDGRKGSPKLSAALSVKTFTLIRGSRAFLTPGVCVHW
jgi:hypothetical protein